MRGADLLERFRSPDRLGVLGDGKPLRFRTVLAVPLDVIARQIGRVDYIQGDIQGTEADIFDDSFP